MKKVMSFLVVSGLCANGSCFGMDWDLAKSKAAAIAKKARKNRTVRKINRKVRKIKKVVKNNRKIQAVLGASTAVAGSALAYRYLEAAKNLTVNVPVSKISGSSVGFLTKALNITKSYPIATGLTTIGGLASIAVAMTHFMKSEATENKVEDQPNNNNSNEKGNPEQPKQEDVKGQPRSEATEDSSNDGNSGGAIPVVTNPENQEQIEVNNILQNHKNLDKQIDQVLNDLKSGKTIDGSVIKDLKNQVESERTKVNQNIKKYSNDISGSIKMLENKMSFIKESYTILTKLYEVTQSFNNDNLDVNAYKKLVDDLKNLGGDALKIYNSEDFKSILTFKEGKSLISSALDAAKSASGTAYDRVNKKIEENPIPIENLISNGDTTVLIDSEDENTVSGRQDYIPKTNQTIQSYQDEDNVYANPRTSNLINAWPIPVEKLIASKNAITTNTNKRERSQSEPIFGSGNNGESNIIPKSKSVSDLSENSKRTRKRTKSEQNKQRKENDEIREKILDVIQKTENLFKDWPTLEKEGAFDQIRRDYNLGKYSERWKALVQKAFKKKYEAH